MGGELKHRGALAVVLGASGPCGWKEGEFHVPHADWMVLQSILTHPQMGTSAEQGDWDGKVLKNQNKKE